MANPGKLCEAGEPGNISPVAAKTGSKAGEAHPDLHLVPPLEVDPADARIARAVAAALAGNFSEVVAAIHPFGDGAGDFSEDDDGAAAGEVILLDDAQELTAPRAAPEAVDPLEWWLDVGNPVIRGVADRVASSPPGRSPEAVVTSAVLLTMSRMVAAHDQRRRAEGLAPSDHPSRMRRLVLVLAARDDPMALAAHAFAICLMAGGATARVVTGPVTPAKLKEVIELARPVAVVVDPGAANGALVRALRLHAEGLPVLHLPAPSAEGAGFAAVVQQALQIGA